MRTRQSKQGSRRRNRGARHPGRPVREETPQAAELPEPLAADRRLRSAARPEDSALYFCSCGQDFRAGVSTTVACPSCGVSQDW